jgi:hypothetical protein
LGIPKFNTSADAPSGLGFNAAMDSIDALVSARVTKPSGISTGEVPVWNGTTWVRSSAQPVVGQFSGQELAYTEFTSLPPHPPQQAKLAQSRSLHPEL